jgi:K+/H+ antiporter YhaU regulatory subunit KhtT
VDVRYTIQMDVVLRGYTDNNLSSFEKNSEAGVNKSLKNEKKRAYAAITDMSDVAKTIAEAMNETNWLAQESAKSAQDSAAALIEQNRLAKQAQLIGLAQHLGKNDLLEQILASFSSASG